MTSFYSWRLIFMTFFGEPRGDHHAHDHAHESPRTMLIPLGVLAVGAVLAGMIWYKPFFGDHAAVNAFFGIPPTPRPRPPRPASTAEAAPGRQPRRAVRPPPRPMPRPRRRDARRGGADGSRAAAPAHGWEAGGDLHGAPTTTSWTRRTIRRPG